MRQKKGFSIVEVVLVMALIGILAVFGIPSFINAKRNLDLKGVVRNIAVALNMAKTLSFRQGPIAVEFDDNEIKVCKDQDKDGICGDLIQKISVPSDINLDKNFNEFYFEKGLPKLPNGAFAAGTITISHTKTNKCFEIIFNRTGRVRIDDCPE